MSHYEQLYAPKKALQNGSGSHYDNLYTPSTTHQSGSGYNRGIDIYRGPLAQRGSGYNRGIEIYRGPLYKQSGAGLGSFLNSAFRYLRPLLSSGINALTQQGIKSAGSVLSQLGTKDLNTILNEEGEKAVRNLSEKAINKLKRAKGDVSSVQKGSGTMPLGFSPLQLQRLKNTPNRKPLKRSTPKKKGQFISRRKVGTAVAALSKGKRQIGSGRKKRKSKKQIGEGRRRRHRSRKRKSSSTNSRSSKKARVLDIFE